MPHKNKPTEDEHFIPKFYLRMFSPDSNGKRVYSYDKSTNQTSKLVPIDSICFEKNIYELRDDNNDIVFCNTIEKSLSEIEAQTDKVIKAIKQKTENEENFYIHDFLSDEEIIYIVRFMFFQLWRDPDTLNNLKGTIRGIYGEKLPDNLVNNFALGLGLPVLKDYSQSEKKILNPIFKIFQDKSYQIAVAKDNLVWTCDNPVILLGPNEHTPMEILFPLTPKIVLYMKPIELTEPQRYNRMVQMTDEFLNCINLEVLLHSKRWVISRKEITPIDVANLILKGSRT